VKTANAAKATSQAKKLLMPPPFPAVVLRLIQEMQNPNAGATDLGKLIEFDPSLSTSLLRLVNSPFFGMRGQVSNVSDAVMVLGTGAVRRMVLSLAVAAPLRRTDIDPAFARRQWLHTVSCAALARRLIEGDSAASELAFTAGLLHDIGQMCLFQLHGAAYVALFAEVPHGDRRGLEKERFGQAHDSLGADLLEAWGLPQAIADVARQHHAPLQPAQLPLVQRAVWVANHLSDAAGEAGPLMAVSCEGLAPAEQATQEARAEIDALAGLLN